VLPSAEKPALPPSASCEDIKAYETDGKGGPTLPGIRLDWESPLRSSTWNNAAITLLVNGFRSEIKKEKDVEYDHQTMSLDVLKKLCATKLGRTQKAVRREATLQMLDKQTRATTECGLQDVASRTQKANRQNTRRRSVSFRACHLDRLDFLIGFPDIQSANARRPRKLH
jgi:hypothetical protein